MEGALYFLWNSILLGLLVPSRVKKVNPGSFLLLLDAGSSSVVLVVSCKVVPLVSPLEGFFWVVFSVSPSVLVPMNL